MRHAQTTLSILVGLSVASAFLGAPAAARGPTTRYVDDDGTAGRSGCGGSKPVPRKVQSAINAAGPGDTILVCPGMYTEQLTIRGARDGLTVKAVEQWTAIIRTPRDLRGPSPSLITIDGVDRVRVQWLRLAIRTAAPCSKLDRGVWIRDADEVQVRSLRMEPLGSDTIGACGYRTGIAVSSGASAAVAYNVIRDFTAVGIRVRGSRTTATLYRNSIHYFHAAEPPGLGGVGIFAELEALVTIRANVIRGGPGPGWPTPVLSSGIAVTLGDGSVVAHNTIVRAGSGIATSWDDLPSPRASIRDNLIIGGTPYSTGILVVDGSTYARNRVSGYGTGVLAVSGDAMFLRNDFRGNDGWDCIDEAANYGGHNTWIGNLGDTSDPAGICSPDP